MTCSVEKTASRPADAQWILEEFKDACARAEGAANQATAQAKASTIASNSEGAAPACEQVQQPDVVPSAAAARLLCAPAPGLGVAFELMSASGRNDASCRGRSVSRRCAR